MPMTLYGSMFRQSSGMKTFSDCSLRDFENFISNMRAQCLQNKPQMQRNPGPICGNGTEEVSLIIGKLINLLFLFSFVINAIYLKYDWVPCKILAIIK